MENYYNNSIDKEEMKIVTKIELSSDHISIFYLVEFQRNDSPPPMLIFLENELEAS